MNGPIERCVVEYNDVRTVAPFYPYGGGIAFARGPVRFNIIRRNVGTRGGGIYAASGVVEYNLITGNHAWVGGGAYGGGQSPELFRNNIVAFNEARPLYDNDGQPNKDLDSLNVGAGLYRTSAQNCIIWGNTALDAGGGVVFFGGNGTSGSAGRLVNCIVWANQAIWQPALSQVASANDQSPISMTHCNVQDWPDSTNGNHSLDPGLVDPAAMDFHLRPDSPNIDAGTSTTLTTDYDGASRPFLATPWTLRGDGSGTDIGPFEYQELLDRATSIVDVLLGKVAPSAGDDSNTDLTIDAADVTSQ